MRGAKPPPAAPVASASRSSSCSGRREPAERRSAPASASAPPAAAPNSTRGPFTRSSVEGSSAKPTRNPASVQTASTSPLASQISASGEASGSSAAARSRRLRRGSGSSRQPAYPVGPRRCFCESASRTGGFSPNASAERARNRASKSRFPVTDPSFRSAACRSVLPSTSLIEGHRSHASRSPDPRRPAARPPRRSAVAGVGRHHLGHLDREERWQHRQPLR